MRKIFAYLLVLLINFNFPIFCAEVETGCKTNNVELTDAVKTKIFYIIQTSMTFYADKNGQWDEDLATAALGGLDYCKNNRELVIAKYSPQLLKIFTTDEINQLCQELIKLPYQQIGIVNIVNSGQYQLTNRLWNQFVQTLEIPQSSCCTIL